jgi:iron(III) transport system ATP-binding protein
VLLQNGIIEQAGTPQEMYGAPATLFVAEFMGNNNTLSGTVTEVSGRTARIAGQGWALSGSPRSPLKVGDRATAIIRLERLKIASAPGEIRIAMPLVTSVYLGNTWEYVFDMDGCTLRGYGTEPLAPGNQLVEIPADYLWLF